MSTINPNLLVSFNPKKQPSAEIEQIFSLIKEKYKQLPSTHPGIAKVRVKDPRVIIKKLNQLHKKNPQSFKVTTRYTPIDKWCKSSIKEMQRHVKAYDKIIKNKEKWKMDIKKRRHRSKSNTVLMKLTEMINKGKVSLSDPDRIIRVELLGQNAGISLLRKEEWVNTVKNTSKE